jgi:DNA invertase Pin-like site-specific DNA recombinase
VPDRLKGMQVLAYLRRSSAPNATTRTVSFEMQESAVRDLAARHGDTIDELLTDWAKSGGDSVRPGYQEMLSRVDAGEVRVIYGYALSRLSRSLLDFADLLERCRAKGVSIRLVQDGSIDLTTASGRGYVSMVAVFAQMERELAQERNAAAVAERRDRGDIMGQAPYGYRIAAGKLVRRSDEDPDAVVAAFREAGSFGRAAKLLNERKVRTRHGKGWTHGVVADILRQQAPDDLAVPLAEKRARVKAMVSTTLARLLQCQCGVTLTPRRYDGVTTYYCSRSYRVPGHGKTTVREAALMPAIQAEAARLRTPKVVEVEERTARHGILEAKHARIVESYVDGVIDKSTRDKMLTAVAGELDRLGAETRILEVPTIDWASEPARLNTLLRALWERVELGPNLMPVRFVWTVPEWRA